LFGNVRPWRGAGRGQLRGLDPRGRRRYSWLHLTVLSASRAFLKPRRIGAASCNSAREHRENGRPPQRTDHHNDTHLTHPYAPT
jgi:hypothetical protein